MDFFVWYFYPQPYPYPETLIGSAPEYHLEWLLDQWSNGDIDDVFGEDALGEYRRAIRDDDILRAMIEDYRAAVDIDIKNDLEDKESNNKIECPSLVLYAEGESGADRGPNPTDVWNNWMTDIRGATIGSSHFFSEKNPEETGEILASFFTSE